MRGRGQSLKSSVNCGGRELAMNHGGPDPNRSFFPTPALDHAAAGVGAAAVAILCMHPLDLIKVKFQVATSTPTRGIGRQIVLSLYDIWKDRGIRGLYRGVGANMAGNVASWGLYFWLYVFIPLIPIYGLLINSLISYTEFKGLRTKDASSSMSASDYLIASAEASQ